MRIVIADEVIGRNVATGAGEIAPMKILTGDATEMTTEVIVEGDRAIALATDIAQSRQSQSGGKGRATTRGQNRHPSESREDLYLPRMNNSRVRLHRKLQVTSPRSRNPISNRLVC